MKPSTAAKRKFCSPECSDAAHLRTRVATPDAETLRRLYCEEGKTHRQIARLWGISKTTVRVRCQEAGIEPRHAHRYPPKAKDIPSQLHQWYVEQRLSTRAIGALAGVSKPTVMRWLKAEDIPLRPTGRGLANRGGNVPTAEELQRFIHVEYKSYEEIGLHYGFDSTAVLWWVNKFEIARHKPWDTMTKGNRKPLPEPGLLRYLYEDGYSLQEIAGRIDVSEARLRRLCDKQGIPVRNGGWKGGRRFTCTDGHVVRSGYEQRVCEWMSEQGIHHVYEPALPGSAFTSDFLANGWYIEIWGVTGNEAYRERRERKRALYAELRLPLIEIGSHAFKSRRKGLWSRHLSAVMTSPPQRLHHEEQQP